jgi:hypothetical protein
MTLPPLPWGDIEAWLEVSDAAEIAADIRAYAEQAVAAEQERANSYLIENARLAEENERLRAALRNLLDMDVAYMRGPKVEEAVEAARAALKEPT